jgi:hypothetical protein
MATTLAVVVEGFDLPGRRCRPELGGAAYKNVHVGPTSGSSSRC